MSSDKFSLAIDEFGNSVSLVGEVIGAPVYSHKFDNTDYYSIRLSVKRSPKSSKYDNIHVFINSDQLVLDGQLVDAGTRVAVTGYLVQSLLHHMSDLSVVANKVELSSASDENAVYIKGTLNKLFDLKELSNTTKVVRSFILHHSDTICNKNRNLSALVNCWNNTARLLDDKFKVSDELVVRGQLESRNMISKEDNTPVVLHQISALTLYNIDNQ